MDIFCDYNYNVLDTKYFIMKLRHKILCHGFGAFAIVKTAILLFWFFAGIHWVWWVSAEWETIPEWSWFLDSGFWNKYDSTYTYNWTTDRTNYWTSDLVEALYGTSSVYVQNWTGYTEETCTDMKVVETPTLPQYLDGNTIYVLTKSFSIPEDYVYTYRDSELWDYKDEQDWIHVKSWCVAVVSNNKGITMSVSNTMTQNWLLNLESEFLIVDNVMINWTNSSYWLRVIKNNSTVKSLSSKSTRKAWLYGHDIEYFNLYDSILFDNDTRNGLGIMLERVKNCGIYNISTYNNLDGVSLKNIETSKISWVKSYKNTAYWLHIEGNDSKHNILENIEIYNNWYDWGNNPEWFKVEWQYHIINNLQIYNNGDYWLICDGNHISFNNVQIYNNCKQNSNCWWLKINMKNNLFNNVLVYNNNNQWIEIYAEDNILNNVWSYNNERKWIANSNQKLTYYCSWLYLFSNQTSDTDNLFSDNCNVFRLDTWNIDSSLTLLWDYITNPLTTWMAPNYNRVYSWYLLNWRDLSSWKWSKSYYTWETIKYSFGIKTPLQVQLLMWSGDDIVASDLPYNSGMYIWATDTVYATWEISYLDSLNINVVTWSDFLTHYSVFGESNAWIFDQPIWQQTGLRWISGVNTWNLNWKRLVVQLKQRNSNDQDTYLATHFEERINIPNCLSTWNNDNFLNEHFWDTYSGENDMWRLQLICALYWKDQTDKTAYTIWWSGRDTTQCSGADMKVLYYTGELPHDLDENTIYVLNTGKVINTDTISMARCSAIVSKSGSILYSTTINSGIKLDNKQYSILDNIAVDWSNIANEWIVLYYSNNITLNNVKSYSNKYCGIYLEQSNDNVLNNIQTYNNESNWIDLYQSNNNNVLNNIQSYNNNNWIYILYGSDNNV